MLKNILLLIVVIGLGSCQKRLKDVRDYYPKVTTSNVLVNADGSLTVSGILDDPGGTQIEYVGFCASNDPNPIMTDAQAIAPLNGSTFSAIYTGFDPYGTYYIRAWAINGYGYAYGDVLKIDSIQAEPIDPPCTPIANTIDLGTMQGSQAYYPIEAPEEYLGVWSFNASPNNMTYKFGSALSTRTFTTVGGTSDPGPGQVKIYFYPGFMSGTLSAGHTVYVNQLTPDSWEITYCEIPWMYSGSTFYATSRFTISN